MPQGDLAFFPHDVGVVLAGYLGGYLWFAARVAPRVVALHRARAYLFGAPPVGAPTGGAPRPPRWTALLGAAPPLPEALLGWAQFGALALGVYLALQPAPPVGRLPSTPPTRVRGPTFGATTTTVANLVGLWRYHRGSLFVAPSVWALTGVVHTALARLARPGRPRLLPRLLGAVQASRGLGG